MAHRLRFYGREMPSAEFDPVSALAELRVELGDDVSTFHWWLANLYCEHPREHAVLRAWTLILRYAHRSAGEWRRLNLPARLSVAAADRFDQSIDMTDYEALCTRLTELQLSDWDLHFYAICLWDDNSPDTPNGPFAMVYPIVAVRKGYTFWAWLLTQLSSSEVQLLHEAGKTIARETDELKYLEPIESPTPLLLRS